MQFLGVLANIGVAVTCCAVLFSVVMVALVVWYWKNQPDMKTSAIAPTPPVAASIEHPTAAEDLSTPTAPVHSPVAPAAPAPWPTTAPAAPAAPAPAAPPASNEPAPEPPSADA